MLHLISARCLLCCILLGFVGRSFAEMFKLGALALALGASSAMAETMSIQGKLLVLLLRFMMLIRASASCA